MRIGLRRLLWRISSLGMITGLLLGCSMAPQPQPATPLPTTPAGPTETSTPAFYQFPESFATSTPFQPALATEAYLPTPTPTPQPAGDVGASGRRQGGAPEPFPNMSSDETINFLLIGADKRTGPYFRTDTLMVAVLRPESGSVTLISIPRDLYVFIPGWGMDRINTAYLRGEMEKLPGGGAGVLRETLFYNLGIRIDHMAMVDFDGFRKAVDVLGGIDLPLVCPYTDWRIKNPRLSDQDPANWELYTVGPGVVHMDGDLALWYGRSRLRSNDFDRGRRQQEVVRAIYRQVLQANLIPNLPDLYRQLSDSVYTDLGLNDLLSLAPVAAKMDAARIRSYYINNKMVTSWITPGGAAVLLPKREKIQKLLQQAMAAPGEADPSNLRLVVEVINGTGNPGWDMIAAERLHYAGFETHITAPGPETAVQDETMLFDLTENQDPNQSAVLLNALGLPVSRLTGAASPGSWIHYRLIVGRDYRPCFNPAALSH